jgi:hypothetical protein
MERRWSHAVISGSSSSLEEVSVSSSESSFLGSDVAAALRWFWLEVVPVIAAAPAVALALEFRKQKFRFI